MSTSFLLKSSLAVTVAGLSFSIPAYSQTSGGAASPELEEIIVTARRVEERLQDVPISIQVFSQQTLTNANVTNATDLSNLTPSLSVNNNFGNENSSFAIRGFVQDPATSPSVGTYFGDVVAARGPTQGTQAGDSVGPGSFFDLQNVQVLKGPQGTLQGRNTTGGAVLLVPQKPTAHDEAFFEVSKGNYDMTRIQGAVNAPLSDTVRFRIAADHQTRAGWEKNLSGIGTDAYNDVNYTAVRASLVIDVTPNLENYTIVSYSKSDTSGAVEKMIATETASFLGGLAAPQLAYENAHYGFWDVATAITAPRSLVEQQQIINTTTWKVSDGLTLKNIASYGEFKDLYTAQLFESNWGAYKANVPNIFVGAFAAPGLYSANQDTYTEELQAQGTAFDSKLTYQGGVYLEWSDPLASVGSQSSNLLNCSNLEALQCVDPLGAGFGGIAVGNVNYTVGRTSFRDQGVYTQESYAFNDQWKLTAGARYTKDKQNNTALRKGYQFKNPNPTTPSVADPVNNPLGCTDTSTIATGCNSSYEVKSSKPTWMINLDYKPADDVLVYGKYARGYRAGGIATNAPLDFRTFSPEKVDNFELGTKTEWHGVVPTVFNVSVFYNNFTNQQLQIGYNNAPGKAVSPTSAIVNAGKSRIYGAEVELSVTPITGLNFDLNYAYLNAKIQAIGNTATTDTNYVLGQVLSVGDKLYLTPTNKAVLSVTYALPLAADIGTVAVGGNVSYTGEEQTNGAYAIPGVIANLGGDYSTVKARTFLGLNAGWKSILGSHVDLTAFGTNVTNKKYYTYIPGLGAGADVEFAALGEPRMYGLRAAYHFSN